MTTQINAVIGSNVDSPTGDIILALQGEQTQYVLKISRGAVVSVITQLVGQMQRTKDKYQGSPDMQPATLTGVQKLLDPDGKPGLVLFLDGGLPLGVLIDRSALPLLRNELLQLEDATKTPSEGQLLS